MLAPTGTAILIFSRAVRAFFGTSPGSMPNQITWNQLAYVLDGLTKGQVYYFKVAAQNSAGWGPNSSVTSVTPFGVPGTLRGFEPVPAMRRSY